MDKIIEEILNHIRNGKTIDADKLNAIIRSYNKGETDVSQHYSKKYLLPYYLNEKENNSTTYKDWKINAKDEESLITILRVKPTRSASGVATITVITKPWKCGGNCIFCPNDIRMPKSYLSNEPACQRAERNFFDPYLQVQARLKALHEMGHNTDKVELIVLGGTWNDYTEDYQRWFVHELFRALNNGVNAPDVAEREQLYLNAGITNDLDKLKNQVEHIQKEIDNQKISYNIAFDKYYNEDSPWNTVSKWQIASWKEVQEQQEINSTTRHRNVGLVFETRPAVVNEANLVFMRKLGCTKVQIGVQSLDEKKMSLSDRSTKNEAVANAFALLRKAGFKIHAHFMANLPGSTPEKDKADFAELVSNPDYLPDEIKLYPCMLVDSARLNRLAKTGEWKAYDEDVLVDVLVDDVLKTPPYTRISRMMRDISSTDITQGVKKTNLRQNVEDEAERISKEKRISIKEIRHREISQDKTKIEDFKLDDIEYKTATTTEHFLQYVTPEYKILGFLRLSLPNGSEVAIIREVHVYGKVANVGGEATNAQHLGLGTKLIEKATKIAIKNGFEQLRVISAIGTREYYKSREFSSYSKDTLYQIKSLKSQKLR